MPAVLHGFPAHHQYRLIEFWQRVNTFALKAEGGGSPNIYLNLL